MRKPSSRIEHLRRLLPLDRRLLEVGAIVMIAFTLVRIRGKSRSITYGAMNIQSPSCGRSGVRDAYAANENLKQSQIWTDHTHSPSHFANLHECGGNSSAVLRPLALDQLIEAIADLSKSSGILSMAKNGEASPMGPRSIPSRESMVMYSGASPSCLHRRKPLPTITQNWRLMSAIGTERSAISRE